MIIDHEWRTVEEVCSLPLTDDQRVIYSCWTVYCYRLKVVRRNVLSIERYHINNRNVLTRSVFVHSSRTETLNMDLKAPYSNSLVTLHLRKHHQSAISSKDDQMVVSLTTTFTSYITSSIASVSCSRLSSPTIYSFFHSLFFHHHHPRLAPCLLHSF